MPNTKHHLTGHTCWDSPNRPVKAPHAYRPKAATWALRRDRKSPNARRVGPVSCWQWRWTQISCCTCTLKLKSSKHLWGYKCHVNLASSFHQYKVSSVSSPSPDKMWRINSAHQPLRIACRLALEGSKKALLHDLMDWWTIKSHWTHPSFERHTKRKRIQDTKNETNNTRINSKKRGLGTSLKNPSKIIAARPFPQKIVIWLHLESCTRRQGKQRMARTGKSVFGTKFELLALQRLNIQYGRYVGLRVDFWRFWCHVSTQVCVICFVDFSRPLAIQTRIICKLPHLLGGFGLSPVASKPAKKNIVKG